MNKVRGTLLLAAAALAWVTASQAEELWNAYPLRGLGEGLSVAAPPQGLYGLLISYSVADDFYDSHGNEVANTHTEVSLLAPALLVVPGLHLLGADYSFLIAEPLVYTHSPTLAGSSGPGNYGAFNTLVSPLMLTWKQGDFHIRAGLSLFLPTASDTIRDLRSGALHNGGLPSGNNFWVVQPDLGLSYLHKGWNATVEFHYADPVSDSTDGPGYRYRSGAEVAGDYTLTKTLGKWTAGLGGHTTIQVYDDTLNGQHVANSAGHIFGLGPMVGYQFGKLSLQCIWNKSVSVESTASGNFVQLRLVRPL